VKSFWPKALLEVLAQGVGADCSEEQFNEYLLEVRLVAKKIVESIVHVTFRYLGDRHAKF
jgi:hypothetical protein